MLANLQPNGLITHPRPSLWRNGMATVYLADDLKHERKVALKGPAPV